MELQGKVSEYRNINMTFYRSSQKLPPKPQKTLKQGGTGSDLWKKKKRRSEPLEIANDDGGRWTSDFHTFWIKVEVEYPGGGRVSQIDKWLGKDWPLSMQRCGGSTLSSSLQVEGWAQKTHLSACIFPSFSRYPHENHVFVSKILKTKFSKQVFWGNINQSLITEQTGRKEKDVTIYAIYYIVKQPDDNSRILQWFVPVMCQFCWQPQPVLRSKQKQIKACLWFSALSTHH